jgi:hypothetical protein
VRYGENTTPEIERVAAQIVDAAFKVHMELGPGILLMVEDCVIVEVKAVEKMIPLFEAQTLTYLKLTGKRLAFLINFNVPLIKDGIKRIIR